MAEKLRLRSNGSDVYVYIEDTSLASFAAGGDTTNTVFALNTSASADVMPDGPTANITMDPTANGDLTLRPHGTGNIIMTGVHSVTPAGATEFVVIDATGEMGSSASGFASDFVTDAGTANPAANVLNVLSGAGVITSGAGSTVTIAVDTSVATSYATDSGSAIPAAGILTVAGGTNMGTVGGGSTVTVNLDSTVSISGSMTAGTGLTATTGDVTADAGDIVATLGDLEATSGLVALPDTNAALDEGMITLGASRFLHNFGVQNTFVGEDSGNGTLTAQQNVGVGHETLIALTSGGGNNALGRRAGTAISTSIRNDLFGFGAGLGISTGLGENVCIGFQSGDLVTTGVHNTFLGSNSGTAATVASSSNICIKNIGAAESNTIRIGTQGAGAGQQDTTFVAGIVDVAVTNDGMVIIDSAGQLGSQINLVLPENAAFLAYNSADDVDVTGAGTTATVDFDTEVFDQGGDFAADTFTAPISARYQLSAGVSVNDFTIGDGIVLQIVTSNRVFFGTQIDPTAAKDSTGAIFLQISVLADMDAADTATVTVKGSGEAGDTNDIMGSASPHETYFSGHLAT